MFKKDIVDKEDRVQDTLAQIFSAYSECVSVTEINGEFYLSGNEFVDMNKKSKVLKLIEDSIRITTDFLITNNLDETQLKEFIALRQERKRQEKLEKKEKEVEDEEEEEVGVENEEIEAEELGKGKKSSSVGGINTLFTEIIYPLARPKTTLKQAASRLTSKMYEKAIEHAINNNDSLTRQQIKENFGHEQGMPALVYFEAMEQWSNLRKAIGYFKEEKFKEKIKNIHFEYDEKENVHAEMKILNAVLEHLEQIPDAASDNKENAKIYIGISKACCFHCHWTLEAAKEVLLKEKGIVLSYRGSHDLSFVKNKNNPNVKWYFPKALRSAQLDPLYNKIRETANTLFKGHEKSKDVFQGHSVASDSEYETTAFENYERYLKSWEEKLFAQSKVVKNSDELNTERKMLSFGQRLSKIEFFKELFDIDAPESDDQVENSFFTLLGHLFGGREIDLEEKLLFCDFLENRNYSSSHIQSYFSCVSMRDLVERKSIKRQKFDDGFQQKQKNKEISRIISSSQQFTSKSLNQNLFNRTIDELKQYELDVPGDGTCLFYSVAFAYLLPVVEKPGEFKERFVKLFGEEVEGSSEENRKLLLQYDGTREFISEHSATFEVLVNVNFRKRVVDLIAEHKEEFSSFIPDNEKIEDRLSRMGDSSKKTHGDAPEIEAMSRLLQIRITVYERPKDELENYKIFPVADGDHGQKHQNRLYLVHTVTPEKIQIMQVDPDIDKDNSHYRFLVKQEITRNLNQFLHQEDPTKHSPFKEQGKKREKEEERALQEAIRESELEQVRQEAIKAAQGQKEKIGTTNVIASYNSQQKGSKSEAEDQEKENEKKEPPNPFSQS